MKMISKYRLQNGFTLVEVIVSVIIAAILAGGLIYVVGEANFFLRKQSYRENVRNYVHTTYNDIFSTLINAEKVEILGPEKIQCTFSNTVSGMDSIVTYQAREKEGILLNGHSIEGTSFHGKKKNKNYYMEIATFKGDYTLDGQGYDINYMNSVIDVLIGVKLYYKRGSEQIIEEFPYKKTIFTIYNI